MDPDAEQQAFLREQDDQFWDNKRREEQQQQRQRGARSRRDDPLPDAAEPRRDSSARMERDATFGEPLQAHAGAVETPAKPKKAGKPVLTGALVLLLILGAAAAFMLWSSGGLPFAKKKSGSSPATALAGTGANAPSPSLPPTEPLPAPVLPSVAAPAVAGAATGQVATVAPVAAPAASDPKLQAQLEQLERRLDQLVTGFKAQGYIKDTAGQNGADLVASDFLPHPSTLPPPAPVPAPVATATRPVARRPVPRPAPAPAAPKPMHQVLSVDMWDGRPSVVVGVIGAPAGQVRVLAPGDTYNGVTLTAVDVAGQRATFSDGARSVSIAVERQQ